MAERIRRRTPAALPEDLPPDLHPVLRRVYARRGVASAEELDLRLARLAPPAGMADLEAAGEALAGALR
ncbi:hypothetical protein CKO13_12170, partial [Halorhodospira neutriphila]|nr:hypothetical protein [Halorhodospira neutriphila]